MLRISAELGGVLLVSRGMSESRKHRLAEFVIRHALEPVYPPSDRVFPIGKAMNKNLTVKMGNCNDRRYYVTLISLVQSGIVDPVKVLTQIEPMQGANEADQAFDSREPGWIKVELMPGAKAT